MKKHLLITLIICACFKIVSAQITPAQVIDAAHIASIADSISAEGKMLALSEMASWYGTDVFLAKCKSRLSRAGGYLSYNTGSGMNNIFFSKDEKPVVLATMSFTLPDISMNGCKVDSTERKLTNAEAELYAIRKVAMAALIANKDSIFRFYKNTGTNPVPIIVNGQKRVYFLTSPKSNGQVIFGNDYLLTFDKDNHITSTKKLHNNLITINTKPAPDDTSHAVQVAGVHNHLGNTSPFITATDICTMILYHNATTWKQYYVISPTYISIWDFQGAHLTIITKEAWDKIMANRKTPVPVNH
ncbi:hypothetical protein [Mucilaginibacter boryungensis]|uniref:Uncharacterized protein n=1 Tax=Mucilaginibacter boryungensis TaxID=768480 RepID=A0ABR9XDQ1_9SPHI|nr:hypothetical protein [Mucilaginibacter boryungensis]MBE9665200.1 hypothetical protein [Mucilaginibacter boryungensis]